MTAVKPLVLYTDQGLSQIRSGDTLVLSSLGAGSPSSGTYLRGDGTWASVSIISSIVLDLSSGIRGSGASSNGSSTISLSLGDITPTSITTGALSSTVDLSTTGVVITQKGTGNALDVVGESSFSGNVHLTSGASLAYGAIYSSTSMVYSTTTTPIDTFQMSQYRSAKYQIQISDGTSYETLEVFVIHDGATVYLTSYGNVFTSPQSLGAFDAATSGGGVALTFSAYSATVKTIKFIRTTISV